MKILSMTATFGKLEHETLTLAPGLNIIQAPNEWGKSTWCAFLVNMLYGIDTRARSTGSALADKERYAPWSGVAMSGRMDLEWNGRHITIERRSKGRVPFGDFNAYETETGIDVPELNAANCGQVLLGVERSVFVRAGFLKLADLPVSQDDALRRRLNNLVTTGDESGAGDKLGQTLKDLKNKCRFNNSGLLPQAENEREQLRYQLQQLHQLQTEADNIRIRQGQLEQDICALKNHQKALEYADSLNNIRQVEAAEQTLSQANEAVRELEAQCAQLPGQALLQEKLLTLEQLTAQRSSLFMRPVPDMPNAPADQGDPAQLIQAAREDQAAYADLQERLNKPVSFWDILLAILTLGIVPIVRAHKKKALQKELDAIAARHSGISPEQWTVQAESYAKAREDYRQQLEQRQHVINGINEEKAVLEEKLSTLTGGDPPELCRADWQQALDTHKRLESAKQARTQAEDHAQALRRMMRTVEAPQERDELTLDAPQTQNALSAALLEQQQLQLRLGQALGQSEALGQEAVLRARLDTLNRRIARLEDTYHALELAQDALYQATTSLQRRFAPRISKQAQSLFSTLTDGRYQRIAMAEDLTLSTGAENEDTLHTAQWRSDGTIDQLYLALRLAVAAELTPDAPLVLDDALVRFDDERLKKAMALLKEEAENKQVILFTCQGREKTV